MPRRRSYDSGLVASGAGHSCLRNEVDGWPSLNSPDNIIELRIDQRRVVRYDGNDEVICDSPNSGMTNQSGRLFSS